MQNKNLNRLNLLKDQLFGTKTSNLNQGKYPLNKSQDDIVIVSYARTALAKAGRGSFKDTQPEVLTKAVIKGCIDRSKVDPKDKQEIIFGNVLGVGSNFIKVRMSQF